MSEQDPTQSIEGGSSDTVAATTTDQPEIRESEAPAAVPVAGVTLRNNPVLRRELIERVQGMKVVIFVTLWLALLILVLILAYQGSVAFNREFGLDVASIGRVGRQIFEWVLFGMLVLVLFLVPGLTAGAITGERERQTLVPLQMTMMRPRDIIVGKLSAALAFLVLLVIIAMPLLAVSFLVGGLGFFDIIRGLGMLIFTGLVLGSVCVALSAKFRRTTASTVVSYATSFIFAVGSFFAMIAFAIMLSIGGDGGGEDPPAHLLAVNPFAAVGDVLPRSNGVGFIGETFSPFGGMRGLIDELGENNQDFDEFGRPLNDGERGPRIWVYYTVIGLGVMAFSIRSASKSVTTPADSER